VKILGYTQHKRLDYNNPGCLVLSPMPELSPNGVNLKCMSLWSVIYLTCGQNKHGVKILVAFG